jgi:signal transduction histidine kinase/DNA-binding response OmpR family regulator/HPt (histidine-containing phosphotransfer) domain-containing protein
MRTPASGRILIKLASIAILSLAMMPLLAAAGRAASRNVLVLNSYHQGLQWTDNIVAGIQQTFGQAAHIPVNLHIEYMDAKHVWNDTYLERLAELYQQRFRSRPFDVVMVSDDNALAFVLKHGRKLFGQAPVVFCGINNFRDEMLQGRTDITGVMESFDVLATLRAAMKLQPEARQILVVNDATVTGQANRAVIEALADQLPARIKLEFLQDYSMAELQARLNSLDNGSIVLLMTFNRDRLGKVYNYQDSVRLVTQACPAPVYGVWDFFLGHGIVGGMITRGFDQGKAAAQMALAILAGTPVSRIPVVRTSPNHYFFDYAQLLRHHLAMGALPAGSQVINQPPSFLRLHQSLIISATIILSIQMAIILVLINNIQQRKKAQSELLSYRQHLENLVAERTLELAQAKEQAEAASRAKSTFLANMSHDLRTPLNAVVGLTGVLQKSVLSVEQRDTLNKVRIASDNLVQIINDVLDFSKVEAGRLELEYIDIDLDDLLDRIADLFSQAVAQKKLELIFDVHPDVPRQLQGDPGRLGQVLTNLVQNAVKFTRQGEIVASVHLDGASTGEPGQVGLKFQVRDTGIGIAPDVLPTIFEAFTQADSSMTRQQEGSGLGLAICRRLVALMGGTLSADSEPGRGSVFCFTVVLDVAHKPKRLPMMPAALHAAKVLVVSGSAALRQSLEHMLGILDLAPLAVADGRQAIDELRRAAQTEPVQLVLLDEKAAGPDPFETASHIAADAPLDGSNRPRFIILTPAHHLECNDRKRPAAPTAAYVAKPVKVTQLFSTIMTLFGQPPTGQWSQAAAILPSAVEQLKAFSDCRILVVDDSPLNRDVAMALLKFAGLHADTAENGREAVEILDRCQQGYDIVLMDIQMPEMDGFQATARIRSDTRYQGLPIIALTAHAIRGEREKCLAAGMDDFIPKPFEEELFYRVLLKWLEPAEPQPWQDGEPLPLDRSGSPADTHLLDVDGALQRLGGRRKIYLKLLGMFRLETEGIPEKIRIHLAAGDWQTAYRMAHNVKAVAATIGATALSEVARQLEATLDANCTSTTEDLNTFQKELAAAQDAVAAFLKKEAHPPLNPAGSARQNPAHG